MTKYIRNTTYSYEYKNLPNWKGLTWNELIQRCPFKVDIVLTDMTESAYSSNVSYIGSLLLTHWQVVIQLCTYIS